MRSSVSIRSAEEKSHTTREKIVIILLSTRRHERDLGRGSGLCKQLIDDVLELLFRSGTDKLFYRLSVFKEQNGRNTHNLIPARYFWILICIKFHDFYFSGIFRRDFIDDR